MSFRLVDTAAPFGPFGNPGHIAKIHWNAEFQEYRVRLYINGKPQEKADYFTNDKQDAENTAIRMIGA